MWSRIRTSSSRYAGNSFVPVHQLDFQSWMTPMRIPPGCTFWPITGHLSSGSCAPAAKRPGGREAGGRGPASNCGLLALRALRGRSAGPAVARRRRGTLSFRPVARRVRNGWRKDHGDVASALLDACDAAARTRAPALDRRALVGIGRGHVEVVADQPVIGLGVCDRRAEDAVELARRDARREREHRPRLRNAPAADGVGNDARLPRGPRSTGRALSSFLLHLLVAGVAAERPRRCELTELVADHLLGDEDGHVLPAVVDGDRVAHHLREDRRRAGPRADHPLLVYRVHRFDPAHQPVLDVRAFLAAPAHGVLALLLAAAPAADDQRVRFLVLPARALAERRHAPRSDRMPAALRLPLAAAVWVVDRVHRRAAHRRTLALPTATTRLAAGLVLVVEIPDLTDGGPAR